MATLVLTAIGSAIGGPIGGAIGAALGQQIDNSVFGGKPREGPRLKELDIQTSSYGSSIPAIFGAMRVAGTVIWATDLIEHRVKSSAGKGRPSTINYSYGVSLAVALSSRPLARIGRIWADGNLLRGAAGDFKVQTGFRFYTGQGDQPLDPLIASAQTTGECPTHRGIAYVVFEDLQLADFGNRIPSLTFEVFERETAVPLLDICSAASAGKITGTSAETLIGYALDGRTARSALNPLFDTFPITLRPKGVQLEILDWFTVGDQPATAIAAAAIGSTALERPGKQRAPSRKLPKAISLRHYEPARDFQSGVQRSERYNIGQISHVIELPAAIAASSAQRLADIQLLQTQQARNSWTAFVETGPKALHIGDRIMENRDDGSWRISEIEHLRGFMHISASRALTQNPSPSPGAEPGNNIPFVDVFAGQTILSVLDLPVMNQVDPGRVLAVVAASGSTPAWRRAALSWRQNNQLIELGRTSGVAIMGQAIGALPQHTPYLVDNQNALEVQFPFQEIELLAGYGSPLAADAPLCWLSGELLRYGQADYLGQGRYRLTKLLRGCFGTELHIGGHGAGERFIVLDSNQLRLLDELPLVIDQHLEIEALGLGDVEPVSASLNLSGNAIIPFAPVHGLARLREDGGLDISWKRRSRINYGWQDGIDHPLVEDSEQYSVRLRVSGQILSDWVVASPQLILSSTETSMIPIAASNWVMEVRQTGNFGVSSPTQITKISI
jgi:hypothetical protein